MKVFSMPLPIFKADNAIIFEGIKGSGKSTQIQIAAEALSKDYSVRVHNSDGIFPIVSQFRPKPIDSIEAAVQESFFIRFMRWLEPINGDPSQIALIDRFVLSDLVYFMERLSAMHIGYDGAALRSQMLYPLGINALSDSLTIYIDCYPEIAQCRVKERPRSDFDINLNRRVRDLYLAQLPFISNKRVIDGSQDKIEIAHQINAYIVDYLDRKSCTESISS